MFYLNHDGTLIGINNSITSIIISHKLKEIRRIANRVTIIRDGATIDSIDMREEDATEGRIIRAMVGRELSSMFPPREAVIGEEKLRVENWTVHHPADPGRKVVDDVSFHVAQGELVTLLGPSGCGKTTTLRMVAGLEPVTEGRVLIGGTDVTLRAANERDVSMVFQSYALFPHMTVLENVCYGPMSMRMDRAKAREVAAAKLGMLGLAGLEGRLPSELSGGQQQRGEEPDHVAGHATAESAPAHHHDRKCRGQTDRQPRHGAHARATRGFGDVEAGWVGAPRCPRRPLVGAGSIGRRSGGRHDDQLAVAQPDRVSRFHRHRGAQSSTVEADDAFAERLDLDEGPTAGEAEVAS